MFKIYISTLFLIFCSTFTFAQNLYNPMSIKEIRLSFNEKNWDKYLDSVKKAGSESRLKGSLTIDGQRFENVGVRYKGNSSYFGTRKKGNNKLPFNIRLDKKQKIEGKYETFKLSNINRDPSFVREMLSYEIVNTYMPAPQCNFAKVYVNDTYLGFYNNVESINDDFLKNQFGKNGWLVKCDPDWTAEEAKNCPKGDKASLMYLGEDSTCYKTFYEIDKGGSWKDFINLTRVLNLEPDKIERVLNVDQVLWMLALNSVMVNLDSYTGLFSHNYYLYRISDGRFTPLMWDLNMSFGAFAMPGVEMTQLDPFFYINDTKRPLISKLLAIPMYRKIYSSHIKTILNDWFYNEKYLKRAKEIAQFIDPSVKDDPSKHFTYDDFKKNISTSVSEIVDGKEVGSKIIGIEELMKRRIEYLKNFLPFQKVAPKIEAQPTHSAMPIVQGQNEKLSVKVKVSGAVRVWCLVRNDKNGAYRYLPMSDDGQHNDEAANDGTWGVVFDKKNVQYYIIAENEDAVSLLPERGGKEFFEVK
jgi:CotH kinase protein